MAGHHQRLELPGHGPHAQHALTDDQHHQRPWHHARPARVLDEHAGKRECNDEQDKRLGEVAMDHRLPAFRSLDQTVWIQTLRRGNFMRHFRYGQVAVTARLYRTTETGDETPNIINRKSDV